MPMRPRWIWAGLIAGTAMSGLGSAALAASSPPMTFITGLINVEDMVRAPGTPWIIASGLADGERTDGHIYLVNARDRSVRALLPGHVDYRPDANAYPACPGKPDEAKFSAHGLSLRRGPQGIHTLYVVHHGERESVEVFKLDARRPTPRLTWVGCALYPAGVSGNGVAGASRAQSCRDSQGQDREEEARPRALTLAIEYVTRPHLPIAARWAPSSPESRRGAI